MSKSTYCVTLEILVHIADEASFRSQNERDDDLAKKVALIITELGAQECWTDIIGHFTDVELLENWEDENE